MPHYCSIHCDFAKKLSLLCLFLEEILEQMTTEMTSQTNMHQVGHEWLDQTEHQHRSKQSGPPSVNRMVCPGEGKWICLIRNSAS